MSLIKTTLTWYEIWRLSLRDRTRVEITLFLRRAQPARRDHWVCVEKTRRKYPNFEKMRRKCIGFFMKKITSEVAIGAEIFHGHQTTTKCCFYIYFYSFVIFLPISDPFPPPKNVRSRRISTRFRRKNWRKTMRREKRVRVRVGRVLHKNAS